MQTLSKVLTKAPSDPTTRIIRKKNFTDARVDIFYKLLRHHHSGLVNNMPL